MDINIFIGDELIKKFKDDQSRLPLKDTEMMFAHGCIIYILWSIKKVKYQVVSRN